MPSISVNDLPNSGGLDGTEVIHGLQSGSSRKITTKQIARLGYLNIKAPPFNAIGNGIADDSAAFNLAVTYATVLNKAVTIYGESGDTYRIASTVAMTVNGLTFDLQGATVQTAGDIAAFQVGANPGSNLAFKNSGIVNVNFVGSGAGNTSNRAIVVRNHSYGRFQNIPCTNFGAKPILVQAYARGVQYNSLRDFEIKGNHAGAIEYDTGTVAGGYVTDNLLDNVRTHENPKENSTNTQVLLTGTGEMQGNRFNNCGFESISPTDTLLHIQNGGANSFWGLRLDGDNATVALRIEAGCNANWFLHQGTQGIVQDLSGTTVWMGDRGTLDLPYLQFGTAEDTTSTDAAFFLGMQQPGGVREFHLKSMATGGAYRFPVGTMCWIGDRDGGDNAPIVLDSTNNRVTLSTLPSKSAGAGPKVRFDGRFASGGSLGIADVVQDANGVAVSFTLPGQMLHSTQAISVVDGMTAPNTVVGRAIIYVDSADGDLKIKFGDGTVKTIVTDT